MRLAVIAVVVLASATAHADRRTNVLWKDICAFVLSETDEGRGELVPFVGTSFGGGLDRYRSIGGLSRLHFADGWVMEMDAHKVYAAPRLVLPVPVEQTRRLGGGSLAVGYTPFAGRLLVTDTTIVNVDLVTAAGAGIVFVRTPHASQFDDRFALSANVTMRFRIQSWLSFDIGVHDEWVPVGDTPSRTSARATEQPLRVPATAHELEVRIGLGFWIPDAPGRICRRRCS